MRRLDVPELGDQGWCPAWIRDAMTAYLQVVIETTQPYDVALPALAEVLGDTGAQTVIDLASGAGGPWRRLRAQLASSGFVPRVTLSDLEPNAEAMARVATEEGIDYLPVGTSALDVAVSLGGVRTMFTALHHFDPSEVRSILSSAQRDRVGFAAFEATQRSWRGVLLTLLIPLLVLALMPRVRPRRVITLALTYLPPLLPLLIWWDGLASTLRTYTADELRDLVAQIAEPGYVWQVAEMRTKGAPIPVLQLTGRPLRTSHTQDDG